ncbi:MAG: RelA/SpoT family protein [Patescibacteria group bacterium]|nr:RelA/SpoT family protein [Patescibacteria group bacterium]
MPQKLELIDLLKKTGNYLNKADQDLITKAYYFAKDAHKGEKRGTGEEYINHPLHSAYLLAINNFDAQTIAAALLHDVAENNPHKIKSLKAEFGPEIFEIIDGVTKLGKIKIKKSWFFPLNLLQNRRQKQLGYERHIESLRKMLLAMAKDLRVVMIKFADRIHNMQTLKGVRPEKRERIARETLEIYAPLAYRLGMGKVKGELEDLAFPYAYPKEYQKVKNIVGHKYEEKEEYLKKVIEVLENKIHKVGIKAKIHGRRKHLYSLYKKLKKYDFDITKIYDLVAVRIIVNNLEDCYKVLGIIHQTWKPLIGRIKDYIAVPKPNGYQSLHTTVFAIDGEIVEIQVRTKEMHDKAENGIAAHWHYKDIRQKPANMAKIAKDQLVWLKELEKWQQNIKDSKEFSQILKIDFFKDRIFVFTPQGDVHDLPLGATPVDFAYAIHSDVGNTCVGAKLNGKMIKLDQPLKNGDIVDIITKKESEPKRDWLKFVKTSRARGRIKSYLTKK